MESSFPFLSDIIQFLPSWSPLTLNDLSLTSLSGCSNHIFKLEIINPAKFPQITPKSLIYRRFGHLTDFIDYKAEAAIFKNLGEIGIGPKTIGSTEAFRLEETIEGVHPARKEMLESTFIDEMAKLIHDFHSMKNLTGKSPIFKDFLLFKDQTQVLKKIRSFIENSILSDPSSLIKSLKDFCSDQEIEFLTEILPKSPESLVFCHNDLNPMNIFEKKLEKGGFSLQLIDFEYSGLNYRGFDIAGFFIELAYDYSDFPDFKYRPELFASDETILRFCNAYLREGAKDESLETLMEEIKVGILQWLFFTGLWCVYQKFMSEVQFDFLAMAVDKFKLYKQFKQGFFS